MSELTQTWTRNSFDVEAVRVTRENLDEVAKWCDGRVYAQRNQGEGTKLYVLFGSVQYNKIMETKAYIGDWIILVDGTDFKHYRNQSFRQSYSPKKNKLDEVTVILSNLVMTQRLQSYVLSDDGGPLVRDAAQKIVNLFLGE